MAAQELAKQNIDATVVNARFAKPLDSELICSLASQVGRILNYRREYALRWIRQQRTGITGGIGYQQYETETLGHTDEFVEHGHPVSWRPSINWIPLGYSATGRLALPELAKITTK